MRFIAAAFWEGLALPAVTKDARRSTSDWGQQQRGREGLGCSNTVKWRRRVWWLSVPLKITDRGGKLTRNIQFQWKNKYQIHFKNKKLQHHKLLVYQCAWVRDWRVLSTTSGEADFPNVWNVHWQAAPVREGDNFPYLFTHQQGASHTSASCTSGCSQAAFAARTAPAPLPAPFLHLYWRIWWAAAAVHRRRRPSTVALKEKPRHNIYFSHCQ